MGTIRITAALLSLVIFAACGAKRTAQSSSDGPSTEGFEDLIADCNEFSLQGYVLDGGISSLSFFPGQTNSQIHLRVDRIDPSFSEGSEARIRFYGWKLSAGQLQLDSQPLQFSLFLKNQFGQLVQISGVGMNDLTADDLESIIEMQALPYANAQALLRAVEFRLEGLPLSWKALRVQVGNSGDGVLGEDDLLIPSFKADPRVYFAEQSNTTLQTLHPLAAFVGQSLSKEPIESQIRALCSLF